MKDAGRFDPSMFARPFSKWAWAATLANIAVIMVLRILVEWVTNSRPDPSQRGWSSLKIFLFFSWLFWVLIMAFYGGAMKMFFATSPSIPFGSVEEGLSMFPGKWKMLIQKSEIIYIQLRAIGGEELFVRYWNYVSTEEGAKELLIDNMQEGFKKLLNPGTPLIVL